MNTILYFVFYLAVLIFSVMVHEVAHGFMAKRLGDDTAEAAGRLTFNPIKHIDPFGSIILPLLLYLAGLPALAWAKPVPYDPRRLYKDFRYGPLKVALAGPVSNAFLFVVFGLIVRFVAHIVNPVALSLFGAIAFLNALLFVFNLIPIPPLDGSKIITAIRPGSAYMLERLSPIGLVLLFLFIFYFSQYIFVAANFLYGLVAGPGAPLL